MRSNPPPNNNNNIVWKLLLIGFISLVIALGGYFALIKLFPFFSVGVSGSENWSLLEGYSSVISLALLIGGLTFALTEYIGNENAKHAEKIAEEREEAKLSYDIYKAIFEKLTAPEQEAARRWILTNITIKKDDEDLAAWYKKTDAKIMKPKRGNKGDLPEGQKALKLTLNCFDYIGFIAKHYWHIEDDSLDWISPPIVKVWRRIGPYVEHVRDLRGTKNYYVSAEYLGNLCIQRHIANGIADEEIAKDTP